MLTLKSVSNFFHSFLGKRKVLEQNCWLSLHSQHRLYWIRLFYWLTNIWKWPLTSITAQNTVQVLPIHPCDIIGDLHLSWGGVSCCLVLDCKGSKVGHHTNNNMRPPILSVHSSLQHPCLVPSLCRTNQTYSPWKNIRVQGRSFRRHQDNLPPGRVPRFSWGWRCWWVYITAAVTHNALFKVNFQ